MIGLQELKFSILKYFKKPIIDHKLNFTDSINSYLANRIKDFTSYLEYGSGSSTIYFSGSTHLYVVSVESDAVYSRAVEKIVSGFANTTKVLTSKTGPTGYWGTPIFFRKSKSKGWKYVNTPWEILGSQYIPDVILIDGRYRVACALNILFRAANKHRITIFFDDYVGRDDYYFFEKYCAVQQKVDRMAIFEYDLSPISESLLLELKNDLEVYLTKFE